MGKGRYLLKRLIYIIFVFFIISILMFFIYKMIPGDPVTLMLGDARNNMKPDAYQELYERTKESLGLNGSLIEQYFRWIGNMLTGNFGYSTQYKQQVINVIGTPMRNTVMLNLFSMLVVFVISIPLGIATAVRRNGIFDKTIQVVTIIGYSLPSFIIALLAIFAFAVKIPLFTSAACGQQVLRATPSRWLWTLCGTWLCQCWSCPFRALAASPGMSAPR